MSNELLSPPTPAIAPPKHSLLPTARFCQVCGVPVRADDYACAVGIGEAELHRHDAIRFIIGARNGPPHRGPKEALRGWLIKI